MTDKALTITEQDELLAQYGTDDEVRSLAARIKKTFPGGDKLSNFQLVAFAQYCRVTDVNPWRGEAYPFVDYRGQFHVIDGYKALVRWAKQREPYSERYEILKDEVGEGDIGYRCSILRHDAIPLMQSLIQAGMDAKAAFDIAATSAVGVVTKREMVSRKTGKPIDPPTGWTWHERARTRALKNALNKSHGAPSPKELAEGSWMVNGTKTVPDDWKLVTAKTPRYEREAIAEGTAQLRLAHENAQREMAAGKTADDAMIELGFDEWVGPAGDPFLNGDYHGASMDADAREDLRGEMEKDIDHEADLAEAEREVADLGESTKKEPPTARRSWPGDIVKAVVDANLAKDPPNACAMLNKSRVLRTTDELEFVMVWAVAYRGAREDGKEPEDAARYADAQMPQAE